MIQEYLMIIRHWKWEPPPPISLQMWEFLQSSQKALHHSKYANRLLKSIFRPCLNANRVVVLWFFLLLRQLQNYKIRGHQKAGVNTHLLYWMKSEAVQKNIHPDGYEGSFFLIETSIQSDLQFCCSNAEYNLTGFLRPDVSKELD